MTLRPWLFPIALVPLLVVGLAAQAQLNPVPAEWVSNSTLTVSAHNFSITAPAGWKWQQSELPAMGQWGKTPVFLAGSEDGTGKFLVVVAPIATTHFSQSDAEQVAKGMTKTIPAGWSLAGNVQITESAIPVAGSALIRARIVASENRELFTYFYMIPGRQSYDLVTYSPATTEPPEFTAFARSFHFIDPSKNASHAGDQNVKPLLPIGLLLVVVLSSWQIRRFFIRRAHAVAKEPPAKVGELVWWRVIVGAVLLYIEMRLILFPEEQALQASNAAEEAGMWAAKVLFIALGIWLVYSGSKGKRRVADT